MKKKIFTIAIGSIAFIAATLFVSVGVHAQIINTIAGNGTGSFGGDGAAATLAQLKSPSSVKVDASGNIYITDYSNHRIRKINTAGTITTVAGSNTIGGFAGDAGQATAARLNGPNGIAIDGSGNMYISDVNNARIRKVNSSGVISTVAGGATVGYSGDGGPATAALITAPAGLNTDAAGNVYFADNGNHVIRKITVATGIITTIAGNGTSGYSGDGGDATAAALDRPQDVFVDASGNLYIADYFNNCIRKVNTSGIISTVAGTTTSGFTGDGGAATAAKISAPFGVWIDASGDMLISDNGNNRIRKVNTSGIISTIAGDGSYSFFGDGGLATAAKLSSQGITADATGNIYFAQSSNHRVRKITPAPVTVSGTTSVCEGSTTTFTGSITGGTWSSSNTAVAAVDAVGVVTGVTSGTATISYTATTGMGTRSVLVFVQPAAITGTTTVCIAASTTLASATSGGTWTSSASATAGIDAAGVVTGVAAGTAAISYSTGFCATTTNVTVTDCSTSVADVGVDGNIISVYPNPTTGAFSVNIPEKGVNAVITVTDILGKMILTTRGEKSAKINCTIPNAVPGNYFIRVSTGENMYRTRLVITN